MDGQVTPALHSIQRYMVAGIAMVGFVTFVIGGWAATSELSGAVMGQGVVVVEFERQESSTSYRRRRWRAARTRG